jgi:hypothetical protein
VARTSERQLAPPSGTDAARLTAGRRKAWLPLCELLTGADSRHDGGPRLDHLSPTARDAPKRLRLIDDQADVDVLTRRHIAELLPKEAAALLLEQRRALPVDQRLLVALASHLGLFDNTAGDDPGQLEAVAAHRAISRQRHQVGDLQRHAFSVAKALAEHRAR